MVWKLTGNVKTKRLDGRLDALTKQARIASSNGKKKKLNGNLYKIRAGFSLVKKPTVEKPPWTGSIPDKVHCLETEIHALSKKKSQLQMFETEPQRWRHFRLPKGVEGGETGDSKDTWKNSTSYQISACSRVSNALVSTFFVRLSVHRVTDRRKYFARWDEIYSNISEL